MVRTRYSGSSRIREGGFSAPHKQDFQAHVTGGDWIHLATHIAVFSERGNVQSELDYINSQLLILTDVVTNANPSTDNAIAIFSGTSGNILKQSTNPLKIDPVFGDIIFPIGTGYNQISAASINSSSQGQGLHLFGQSNSGGQGGDLILGTGYNFISGKYDGKISLYSSKLEFESSQINPVITQTATSGLPNSLSIKSQQTTGTSTPSNLILESGLNSLGARGNIKINCWPGKLDISAAGVVFSKNYITSISQEDVDALYANGLYIIAQGIVPGAVNSNGVAGNLYFRSGTNYNNNHSGDICLQAYTGNVKIWSSNIKFESNYLSPTISQDTFISAPNVPAQDLSIISQSCLNGPGGNLILGAGTGYEVLERSNIYLLTKNLLFDQAMTDVNISQPTVSGMPSDMSIVSQSSNFNKGSNLNFYSGRGYISNPPAAPGDDGNINIFAGNGQVNIGGTAYSGTGSVNLMGPVFFPNTLAPETPLSGVFIWAYNGNLFCKGPNGDTYQLNASPVTLIE